MKLDNKKDQKLINELLQEGLPIDFTNENHLLTIQKGASGRYCTVFNGTPYGFGTKHFNPVLRRAMYLSEKYGLKCTVEGSDGIVTRCECPPIPVRYYDWSAVRSNYDIGDPVGSGENEHEAIKSLILQEIELTL